MKGQYEFKTDIEFAKMFPEADIDADRLEELMNEQKMLTSSYLRPEPFNTKLPGLQFFKLRVLTRNVLKKAIAVSEKASIHSYDSSQHFLDLSA